MTGHRFLFVVLALGLMPGCQYLDKMNRQDVPMGPRFTDYTTEDFDWDSIQRVVVMPVANRSDIPQIADQMQQALAAEMRRNGRFEVLMSENSAEDRGTAELFLSGRFDERDVLRLYHRYGAQGLLFVKVSQYFPYTTPRIGLSMLLVSPAEGVVVAATDGLWDLRQTDTQKRARKYVEDYLDFDDSLFETNRVMLSPYNFQRFVAYEVSDALEMSTGPQFRMSGSGIEQAGFEEGTDGGSGLGVWPFGGNGGGLGRWFGFGDGAVNAEYCEPATVYPLGTRETVPDAGAVPQPSLPPMNPVLPPVSEPEPMAVPVDPMPPAEPMPPVESVEPMPPAEPMPPVEVDSGPVFPEMPAPAPPQASRFRKKYGVWRR